MVAPARRYIHSNAVSEHIVVAEKALGKKLPKGAIVHHVDMNEKNNSPTNLVICPNQEYHTLLHVRMRARDACGNLDWRKCPYCKQYDAIENLIHHPGKVTGFWEHKKCVSAYVSRKWKEKKEKRNECYG